jgi:hypothetical protein
MRTLGAKLKLAEFRLLSVDHVGEPSALHVGLVGAPGDPFFDPVDEVLEVLADPAFYEGGRDCVCGACAAGFTNGRADVVPAARVSAGVQRLAAESAERDAMEHVVLGGHATALAGLQGHGIESAQAGR